MTGPAIPRTVVLTGMMGTGKTTVGRLLAERLGRSFVDLDAEIARAAGRSVTDIFAAEGEAGFRARERAAACALPGDGPARVVATGGWTLADPASRAHLEGLGPVVMLSATPETLARRLAAQPGTRPLLPATEPAAVTALLARRRPVYDSLPLQVDTSHRTPAEVADALIALLAATGEVSLEALPVATPTGGYRVLVGVGLLPRVGALLVAQGVSGRILVVADDAVGHLYGDTVTAGLAAAGLSARQATMGVGEAAKSLATVHRLYDACAAASLDRHDTVLALGGGIVTDTAGFVAATWHRGLRLVTVPTTLLAMVDAGLGGKTGVNMPAGKNLVGAFHHPAVVVADPAVLATLPPDVLRAGLAETVKHGLIGAPDLFAHLSGRGAPAADDTDAWAALVARSARVKAAIVSADPHEHDRRLLLNLGHTFAHALELATDYRLPHGDAVSVGLLAATHLAADLGHAPRELVDAVAGALVNLDLPVRYAGPSPDEVVAAMALDKKRRGERLRFVLPFAIGDVRLVPDVPTAAVQVALARVWRHRKLGD